MWTGGRPLITTLPQLDLLPLEALAGMAECLKVMAHPIRLRMVDILMHGDFTVGEIAELCEIRQNQACEHLRHMQSCGLLTSERRGQRVYYKVASSHLPTLLGCVRSRLAEEHTPGGAG